MKWNWQRWLLTILAVILVVVLGASIYAGSGYKADLEAVNAMALATSFDRMEQQEDGTLVFYPHGEYETGLIFYPGGAVEFTAYLPLMAACAEKGILTVLVPMPLNLAVLDADAAVSVPDRHPGISHWYLGGHSLGGSMAAQCAAENALWVEGVVLLGAYSQKDLSGLRVMSIVGSEDGVLNWERYEAYKTNLPPDLQEVLLEGGNHAFFGVYGPQRGDGTASISNAEQIARTADLISAFLP